MKNNIVVLLDPPYGVDIVKIKEGKGNIGWGGRLGFVDAGGIVPVNPYPRIMGDETTETAKKTYKLLRKLDITKFIIWGGNYMTDFLPPSACWIIWDKRVDIPSNNFADCEIAWTSFTSPSRIFRQKWSGLLREGDRKSEGIKRLHPTQKPVGVLSKIIKQYTEKDDIIVDLFGGSGSTLIACEQTNRICYMMEIDPIYCDVIINRWEQYTGEKAELIMQ